ncbi:hypothetical protein K493DRAFT_380524 [Basidiobolus meristosporus CBS 931.73]|uniref:BZIP domain-containing protein n=1 Tax=Basidiobolus meristosporus CBS 931.73 TaxID=1314790 RepID=A0A1Y1XXS9_9FUNG|nr:hypothetical protein K493DRAFT_380524 [Basidiobolus meristosporus CBS 931.73]|eukprot:ORX90553.1 hypothetical protein K493DRAFT_380524 [Basidiobolus meristosporus CBS 931.73]
MNSSIPYPLATSEVDDQILELDNILTAQLENATLLTGYVTPLDIDSSPSKVPFPAHQSLEKIPWNQPLLNCTSSKVSPVNVTFSPSTLSTESSTIPDLSTSLLDGSSLAWGVTHNLPSLSSQASMYQYTNADLHCLLPRCVNPPDSHLPPFDNMPPGRKRSISWIDVETHSFGGNDISQISHQASPLTRTRRFSLHLPVQATRSTSTSPNPRDSLSIDYSPSAISNKPPNGVDGNANDPVNLPVVYESLTKLERYLPSTNHGSEPRNVVGGSHKSSQKVRNTVDISNDYSAANKETPGKHQALIERRLSRRRERNRLAARRSREKRSQHLQELEQGNRALSSENAALKVRLYAAIQELQMLRATKID